MSRTIRIWLFVVLLLAAAGVGLTFSPGTFAQTSTPSVLSGSDVGFRVEGFDRSGNVRGTWVVRMNDKWVPAVSVPTVVRP